MTAIFNDPVVQFNYSITTFNGNPVPAAPVLSLTPTGNNSVSLSWTSSTGALNYTLYVGLRPGVYSNATDVALVTTYAISGLASFDTFYFMVKATGSFGDSLPSNELSFAVTIPIPDIYVDLSQVMPEVFRKSPLLTDYMNAISTLMGTVQDEIAELYYLANPYTVPTAYLQNLADLIGLQLRASDFLGQDSQRQQLKNAVAWYKIKGTYQSLTYIAFLLGLNTSIQDFWCDSSVDYNSGVFVPEPWFVDATGSSYPADLSSNYFKTPHFGIYILLNQAYGTFPSQYLWNDAQYPDLSYFVEQTRPVHTVPHYFIQLNASAKESGGVTQSPGNVYGAVTNWSYTNNFYDNTVTQNLTANFYSGFNWGILTSYTNLTVGTVKLYTSTGTLLAQDNGAGSWTALASGYTITGSINYTTGVIKVNVSPSLGSAPYITYGQGLYDNGLSYDDSYTAFLNSITKWKLGTGNVNATNPPTGGINHTVLSGTGVTLKQFTTYNQFTVTVPQGTVQSGLTEFGLYLANGTTPVFIAYFPSIAKTSNEALNIVVTINRQ